MVSQKNNKISVKIKFVGDGKGAATRWEYRRTAKGAHRSKEFEPPL
jgi:hypothetical protein